MYLASCLLFALVLLAPVLPAQPVSLYTFDVGCQVIDFGSRPSSSQPPTLQTSLSNPFVPGETGTALRGLDAGEANSEINFARCGTGLFSSSPDWTIGMWIRRRSPGPQLEYLAIATNVQNRALFAVDSRASVTGGPGEYLAVSLTGTAAQALHSQTRLETRTALWTHVALVHDGAQQTLTMFLDGAVDVVHALSAPLPTPTQLAVGQANPSQRNHHDLDELFVFDRVLTAAEVAAASARPLAGIANLSAGGCSSFGFDLDWVGGPPVIPSQSQLRVTLPFSAPAGTAVAITFGDNPCTLGSTPLPLSLGTVLPLLPFCNLVTAQNLGSVTVPTVQAGQALSFPVSVPAAAVGRSFLWMQAFAVQPDATVLVSDGLGLAIGY